MKLTRGFAALQGYATAQGTAAFRLRNKSIPASHFRQIGEGMALSSIGLGTYIGAPDDETDAIVQRAIETCVEAGAINHIDTAINYRYQKAERSVGKALRALAAKGYHRNELWLSSKIGYIPEDADNGLPGSTVVQRLINAGKMKAEEVAGSVHCLHPAFLQDQLSRSLSNLGVATLDLLYLHNPCEGQMPITGNALFLQRLAKAFEFCESAKTAGLIRNYGLATWLCFRSPSDEEGVHMPLVTALELAAQVGGEKHGLKFIQLPVNLMMPEAFVQKWQPSKSGEKELFLNVAADHKVHIVTSSPLMQGKLVQLALPKKPPGLADPGAQHVQLIRSLPSSALVTTLVGLKSAAHVQAALSLCQVPPLTPDAFWSLLKPESNPQGELAIHLR